MYYCIEFAPLGSFVPDESIFNFFSELILFFKLCAILLHKRRKTKKMIVSCHIVLFFQIIYKYMTGNGEDMCVQHENNYITKLISKIEWFRSNINIFQNSNYTSNSVQIFQF